jgi:hypothetical protein
VTRRIAVLTVAALLAAAGAARSADPAGNPEAERAAEAAARSWLVLVDAGKYGASWDAAAAVFRTALTRAQWEAALEKVRRPLGGVTSRKLRAARFMTDLPGAPKGEYVVIQFDTSFESAPGKTETVTPSRESDGSWRVSGYYIK